MSSPRSKIDTAKFKEHQDATRQRMRSGQESPTITTRAQIRLVEDQLKEARVGEYTLLCDEAKSRRGGGKAPSPLAYFVAAVGF